MTTRMVFISHATKDKPFAIRLLDALRDYGVETWIDHRALTAGHDLTEEIKTAIQEAEVFVLLLSMRANNSYWVADETDWALSRGEAIQIVPLLLDGIKPTAAKRFLGGRELKCIEIEQDNLQAAMVPLLAALRLRLPDYDPLPVLESVPVEELILHLSQPSIVEKGGKRRGRAKVKLVYRPANGATMESPQYTFDAPLGPIEAEEISWYLERFTRWPGEAFRARAEAVETMLPVWGQKIFQASMDNPKALKVRMAWEEANQNNQRRFTVQMDEASLLNTPSTKLTEATQKKMAAMAHLLSLPWELLHNGNNFLFQGMVPVRVRRQLPNLSRKASLITKPPLRVLLLSPRPEDKQVEYIDHRVTAKPVAEILAELGELAALTILEQPTMPALAKELRRAAGENKPYHVVHFDGHGVYLQDTGLGALCFEAVGQENVLFNRKIQRVDANELVGVLAGLRMPMFFLEACQTAQTELDPTASVAAALLEQGVAAVAAMSHSVLVVTAAAFVTVFYQELAKGARVGEAMLAGQLQLYSYKNRGDYLGAGTLELHDWFVPVLYQEEGDPALVVQVASKADKELIKNQYLAHLGDLPEPPAHHFSGRSRELLALERLLLLQNYAVLLGEGGEGKTALGVEAARWLVRIQRVQRVAFVSLESATHPPAVLDAIGRQLVGKNFSVAALDWEQACLQVERVLRAETIVLVLDNCETVLPPRAGGQAGAYDKETLAALLELFLRFQKVGDTRLLFTSRERLPEPFDAERNHRFIGPMAPWDAVEMVKNVLQRANVTPAVGQAVDKEAMLLDLVNGVHHHARTLALLAPELARQGVAQTTATLHQLMASLEEKYPRERERSLYAGVALSLNRLSPKIRQAIRPLGVFQGGGHLGVIGPVLEIEDQQQLLSLVDQLAQTGLCDLHQNGYLTFHFALSPFLWGELSESERQAAQERWLEGEEDFVQFLAQQAFQDAQLSATLTLLDLNNLLAGMERAAEQWPAERAIQWTSRMTAMLHELGKKSAQQQVAALRVRLVAQLGEGWSLLRFNAALDHIQNLAQQGALGETLAAAQTLLQQCLAVGEAAYPEAGYDLAMAYWLLGTYTYKVGNAVQAVPLHQEARRRFQQFEHGENLAARKMAAGSLYELGDCCRALGKLEEAAQYYEQAGQESTQEGNQRGVAVSKGQLGTVRMLQQRYPEALAAYQEAREMFTRLNEPFSVATIWHQTGMVHAAMQAWAEAEAAYRESLKVNTSLGNKPGEAMTLIQLGNLFNRRGRWEEAVAHYRKATKLHLLLKDQASQASEGLVCNNLADTLVNLGRLAEARQEIARAIECKKTFGHAATPWKSYNILARLETADGHPEVAAKALLQARSLFLQYRRDGGENYQPRAKLCQEVATAIQQGAGQQIQKELEQVGQDPQLPSYAKALILVLLAILSGDRAPTLADTPGLDFDDAVEVELLLEILRGGG